MGRRLLSCHTADTGVTVTLLRVRVLAALQHLLGPDISGSRLLLLQTV